MPDFSTIGGSETKVETGLLDTGNSLGIGVAPSATIHTKGAWVTLNASTSFDYECIKLYARKRGTDTYLVDIAVGSAGNEEVIVSNVPYGQISSSTIRGSWLYDFPIHVAKGSRISVRCQYGQGSGSSLLVSIQGMSSGFNNSAGLAKVVDHGVTEATTDPTLIDPGTTVSTKGSYVELTASTNEDIKAFIICTTTNNNTANALAGYLMDVAIGGAGSEVIIVPDMFFYSGTAESCTPNIINWPIQIPAGSRISVRMQCSINDGTDRLLRVALLGIV